MILRAIFFTALAFAPRNASCAWARIEIAAVHGRIDALIPTTIKGKPALAFAEQGGSVNFLTWTGNSWATESVPVPFRARLSLAIGGSQSMGWPHIYVGAHADQRVLQLRREATGWNMTPVAVPGVGTAGIAATISRADGRPLIVINRYHQARNPATGSLYMDQNHLILYECGVGPEDWNCREVAETKAGPFLVNPVGERRFDLIIGLSNVLKREPSGTWSKIGSYQAVVDAAASPWQAGVLYTTRFETRYSDDFVRATGEFMPKLPVNFISVSPGRLHPDRVERVYRSAEDRHIYEAERSSGGWRMTDLGKTRGVPWHIETAALRPDKKERLYVAEMTGGGRIVEYTYFDRATIVAVAPLIIETEGGVPGLEAGRILAQAFRSELAAYEHLKIVESESADAVEAERDLQLRRCAEADCIKRLGRMMKAEAVITGTLSRSGGSLHLILNAHHGGRKQPTVTVKMDIPDEDGIFPALRTAARDVAQRWPQD